MPAGATLTGDNHACGRQAATPYRQPLSQPGCGRPPLQVALAVHAPLQVAWPWVAVPTGAYPQLAAPLLVAFVVKK
ncbi:hypothetical protein GW17_00029574 [Ensete ventricosum]|nr:hypothetical protein GW17_00029574 [Ensete ventricosum]RZS20750.1 hypothetical protein BHM03_00053298 [Ensete ventricosum]